MSFSYFSSAGLDEPDVTHQQVDTLGAVSQISKLCVGAKLGVYSSDWIELMKLRTILAEIQVLSDKVLTDNALVQENK